MKVRAAVTPVVLIALATGAAAYAYLVDRGKVSDADRAARRSDVFPSFRIEDVRRIELDHGGERLVLEREDEAGAGANWAMTSPRAEHADQGAVDALLRELELATWIRRVTDADSLGLGAPERQADNALGPVASLFAVCADAARPEGSAYLRLDGEGTFVVGRSVAVQLLRGADAYRERALVPYGGSETARIETRSRGGAAVVLERHGATFRLNGGLRASRTATDRMLMALADARAEVFIDDATADAATRAPVLTVAVGAKDTGRPGVELRIGEACPGRPDDVVVVRTSPTRVSACASKNLLEALGAEPSALADESPFFARADEIEELRLEAIGAGADRPNVELARRGTSWHERSPDDRELSTEEADSANALALALAGARGTDVRMPAPNASIAPYARASLVRTGGETREVVELSRPGADGTFVAHRIDDGALLRLPLAAARHLLPRAVVLRARALWRTPFDPASVLSIDDTCGPTPQRLELRDGSWTMLDPPGLSADAVSSVDLASAIAHAKADAWVAGSDDGTFGFHGAGACTFGVSLSSPTDAAGRHVAVVFGDRGEGGFYAHTLDDPAVFLAPKVLRDLATHPAIDASAFRIDPARLSSILLDRGEAGTWGPRARASTGMGANRAAPMRRRRKFRRALARALSSLYALAALHPGSPPPRTRA